MTLGLVILAACVGNSSLVPRLSCQSCVRNARVRTEEGEGLGLERRLIA